MADIMSGGPYEWRAGTVQEGQRYTDLNTRRLFSAATQQWKGIERLVDPRTRGPRDQDPGTRAYESGSSPNG